MLKATPSSQQRTPCRTHLCGRESARHSGLQGSRRCCADQKAVPSCDFNADSVGRAKVRPRSRVSLYAWWFRFTSKFSPSEPIAQRSALNGYQLNRLLRGSFFLDWYADVSKKLFLPDCLLAMQNCNEEPDGRCLKEPKHEQSN
jgi:hypothetical protein